MYYTTSLDLAARYFISRPNFKNSVDLLRVVLGIGLSIVLTDL